ncbi:MAG: RluA family pseudouridine synthase [Candidatus Omnitrophica bacterium]|nr:RluA family pseudouridine synthase [Candidatus Omnitrophota bacterium]
MKSDSKPAYKVVFEDEFVIVVNKLVKILIQPSPKKEKNTLTSLLRQDLNVKVYPCHRLDRETSGLIIYAKDNFCEKNIMDQFRRSLINKKYLCFVKGRLKRKKGLLEGEILDKEGRRFGEKAKKAKTLYRVIKEFDKFSFLELTPFTGRTNQLRIQLADIGHPILGEDKYAFRRDFPLNFKRLALHASCLEFTHPRSRKKISLEIELPYDMKSFLQNLFHPRSGTS